jgi:large subunit ribosomal protein L22
MRYTAKHRYADVSARKIRPFANLVRGRNVDDALQLLRFYHNRGAKLLMAVIQSAYGNADDQECPEPDELLVHECRVDGAPMFKRIQPRARGTAFQIKRRMAHIIVSLVDPEDLLPPSAPELPGAEAPAPALETTTPAPALETTTPAPQLPEGASPPAAEAPPAPAGA